MCRGSLTEIWRIRPETKDVLITREHVIEMSSMLNNIEMVDVVSPEWNEGEWKEWCRDGGILLGRCVLAFIPVAMVVLSLLA